MAASVEANRAVSYSLRLALEKRIIPRRRAEMVLGTFWEQSIIGIVR